MATEQEIADQTAKVNALNDAIASGARAVMLGGQQITYNTSQSLIQARDDQQKILNAMTGGGRRRKQTYGYLSTRGYD